MSLVLDGSAGITQLKGTGTTTNDSAAAGYVGEYKEAFATDVSYPTSTEWGDAASISLTAGDWDVSVAAVADSNSSTWTFASAGISVTTGNFSTGLVFGSNWVRGVHASSSTTPLNVPLAIPSYRISLAATTTVYLKMAATYSAGTPHFNARISARRVR